MVNRPMTPLVRRMFGALFMLGAVLWRDDGEPPSSPVARVLPQTRLEDLNPAMVFVWGGRSGAEAPDRLVMERRYAVCVGLIEKLRETLRREE